MLPFHAMKGVAVALEYSHLLDVGDMFVVHRVLKTYLCDREEKGTERDSVYSV